MEEMLMCFGQLKEAQAALNQRQPKQRGEVDEAQAKLLAAIPEACAHWERMKLEAEFLRDDRLRYCQRFADMHEQLTAAQSEVERLTRATTSPRPCQSTVVLKATAEPVKDTASEEELAYLRQQQALLEKEMVALQQRLRSEQEESRALRGQLLTAEQRQARLTEESEKLQQRLRSEQEESRALREQLSTAEQTEANLTKENERLQERLALPQDVPPVQATKKRPRSESCTPAASDSDDDVPLRKRKSGSNNLLEGEGADEGERGERKKKKKAEKKKKKKAKAAVETTDEEDSPEQAHLAALESLRGKFQSIYERYETVKKRNGAKIAQRVEANREFGFSKLHTAKMNEWVVLHILCFSCGEGNVIQARVIFDHYHFENDREVWIEDDDEFGDFLGTWSELEDMFLVNLEDFPQVLSPCPTP